MSVEVFHFFRIEGFIAVQVAAVEPDECIDEIVIIIFSCYTLIAPLLLLLLLLLPLLPTTATTITTTTSTRTTTTTTTTIEL